MTAYKLHGVVSTVWHYIVRGLALIGAATVLAAMGYLYSYKEPTKVALSELCINSACDMPCTKKPSRFMRHAGPCK